MYKGKYSLLDDITRWRSWSDVPRSCVNRIRLWPLRRDDHSGVLIGPGVTQRSDWPARGSLDSPRAKSDRLRAVILKLHHDLFFTGSHEYTLNYLFMFCVILRKKRWSNWKNVNLIHMTGAFKILNEMIFPTHISWKFHLKRICIMLCLFSPKNKYFITWYINCLRFNKTYFCKRSFVKMGLWLNVMSVIKDWCALWGKPNIAQRA